MSIRITYLQFVAMAAFMLVFLGCSSDDEPTTNVPPQTTDSESVSMMLSLGALTRATGMEGESGSVKIRWEQGDKVYFNYTKTFADDREILNVFTVESIDDANPSSAVFTCPEFIMPRGIEEGQLVYVGKKEVHSLADLSPESISLGAQVQNGNNSLAAIGNYLYMATTYFRAISPEDVKQATLSLKHIYSLVTLQVKRPEGWTGNELSEIALSLNSENVTLLGTTDNRIVMTLQNAVWNNDLLMVHFIVNMAGLINEGNTWTVNVKEAGSQNQFKLTYAAKLLESGKHYTSLVSSDPSDYETPVEIEIPGFEDGGDAFE